ncbi:MAG: hypothetical protein BWY66_00406 [bacterium ADurb.Bin374]|nr:MAG: hypothetical protein BWY66_00406 [bacterium ADurb.Bin374]
MSGPFETNLSVRGYVGPVRIVVPGEFHPREKGVEEDKRLEHLPELAARVPQEVREVTENAQNFLAFFGPEARKTVVEGKELERFHENCLARPRGVVNEALDEVLTRRSDRHDVTVAPDGEKPVLENLSAGVHEFGQAAFDIGPGLGEFATKRGQTRRRIVAYLALVRDRLDDLSVGRSEGGHTVHALDEAAVRQPLGEPAGGFKGFLNGPGDLDVGPDAQQVVAGETFRARPQADHQLSQVAKASDRHVPPAGDE